MFTRAHCGTLIERAGDREAHQRSAERHTLKQARRDAALFCSHTMEPCQRSAHQLPGTAVYFCLASNPLSQKEYTRVHPCAGGARARLRLRFRSSVP